MFSPLPTSGWAGNGVDHLLETLSFPSCPQARSHRKEAPFSSPPAKLGQKIACLLGIRDSLRVKMAYFLLFPQIFFFFRPRLQGSLEILFLAEAFAVSTNSFLASTRAVLLSSNGNLSTATV